MKYLLILFLSLFCLPAFSQDMRSDKLVQVSGIITDSDSNSVVPYVTVKNITSGQSLSANYQGYFSFVAHPGDIITFSAIGFTTIQHLIPADLTASQYTLMVKIKPEIIFLRAVQIYPWATVEDFTRSFLALKIADDDMEIAKKNLSPKSIRQLSLTLPRDGGEINSMNQRLEHDRALNKNMVQTNPLLNPFAWGRLLQSIISGDKSRQSEN